MSNGIPLKFLCTLAFTLVLATGLVTAVQYAAAPSGTEFTGYSYESGGDIFIYLNFIEQAAEGRLSFENFFSSDRSGGTLWNPLFLIIGWIARALHLAPIFAWHLVRIAFIPITVFVLWRVLQMLEIPDRQARWSLVCIVALGSLPLANVEASPFVLLLYSPLHPLSFLCTAAYIGLVFRLFQRTPRLSLYISIVALFIVQAMLHPYSLIVWCMIPCIVAFMQFAKGRRLRELIHKLLPIACGGAFSAAYLWAVLHANETLHAWAATALIPPWSWRDLLFFLLPAAPALLWVFKSWRVRYPVPTSMTYLYIVVLVTLLLARSPYLYAGRLTIYAQLPLMVMLGLALHALWAQRKLWMRAVVVLWIPFGMFGNIVHLTQNILDPYPPYGYAANAYLPQSVMEGFAWMKENLPSDALLLTSPQWDTILASYTHRHVYVTQGWMMPNLRTRLREALLVYGGHFTPEDLRVFLQERGITHILLSDRDKLTGYWQADLYRNADYIRNYRYQFDPLQYPWLMPVYEHNGMTVYEVEQNNP